MAAATGEAVPPLEPWARALLAVAWVAVLSPLWVLLGPPPVPGSGLWPSRLGQQEWRDPAWLLAWWVLTPLLYLAVGRWPALRLGPWVRPVLGLAGLATLASRDVVWEAWPGFAPCEVALGCALALGATGVLRWWWGEVGLTLLAGALALGTACLLWETPQGVFDPFHLPYTLDEILAPSAGRWPWVDYLPQYTGLLGAPLAALTLADPQAAGLAWFWMLTGLLLAALVLAQVGAFGMRGLWLHLAAVAALPVVTAGGPLGLPGAYHANYPLRLIGPALAYAGLVAWLRAGPAARLQARWLCGLGALGGMAVLANVEFGGCALVALAVVGVLRAGGRAAWGLAGVMASVGGLLAWYVLWLGALPDLTASLTFIRLFGATGLLNVELPAWGLHTAVAAGLAFMALGAGACLRRDRDDPALAAWTYLGVAGLGMLGYFVGRSVPPSLLGGALPCLVLGATGWAAQASRCPATDAGPAWQRWSDRAVRTLPLVLVMTLLPGLPRAWEAQRHPLIVRQPGQDALAEAPRGTALLASHGNLLSLRTGLPNSLPFNHPTDVVGPAMADCYCEALARGGFTHLLVEPLPAVWGPLRWARHRPACSLLALDDAALQRLWKNIQAGRWTLLPLSVGLKRARPKPPPSPAPDGPPLRRPA
jgi:hypothetical protein